MARQHAAATRSSAGSPRSGLAAEPELPTPDDLLLPIQYRRGGLELRLFSTIATIGAPYDITLEELRLETLFPADAPSAAAVRSLSDT